LSASSVAFFCSARAFAVSATAWNSSVIVRVKRHWPVAKAAPWVTRVERVAPGCLSAEAAFLHHPLLALHNAHFGCCELSAGSWAGVSVGRKVKGGEDGGGEEGRHKPATLGREFE
jgi:hypothetical protein